MDERLDGVCVCDHLTRMYVSSLPLLHLGNKMLNLCHYRQAGAYRVGRTRRPHFLLPPTKEEVPVFARVRLSICLLARLLKNACMDLDEMLRADRCRDMDRWTNWLTFEPDPDDSPDAGTGLLSPISYKRCNAEFYYVGKIPSIRIGQPSLTRGAKMVLFTASRRNTFVWGTCALPSALLWKFCSVSVGFLYNFSIVICHLFSLTSNYTLSKYMTILSCSSNINILHV